MKASPVDVVVMGGTFDPVHLGHTGLARQAADKLGVGEIRLIPSLLPPHRDVPGATALQRLDMLNLAVAGQSGFNVDGCELERGGVSYSIDTLRSLRQEFPAPSRIYFLMGYDAYQKLPEWKMWQDLLDYVHIVILQRAVSEYNLTSPMQLLEARCKVAGISQLQKRHAGRIAYLPVEAVDISATRIRELLKSGSRPTDLMEDKVIEYIFNENLYGVENWKGNLSS